MKKWILLSILFGAVVPRKAAAEPPPQLAVRDRTALRGWAHIKFGQDIGYTITNGVDTIAFLRVPPQFRKDIESMQSPDGRSYPRVILSCANEMYAVIGDFGGRQDAKTLAPMTAFGCPRSDAEHFEFPDEEDFQELVSVREPRRFLHWDGNKSRRGPVAMYASDEETLVVQAALPAADRTEAGIRKKVQALVCRDEQSEGLRVETRSGVRLFIGHDGTEAVAARFLSCERGTLFIISRVEKGSQERAVSNALQVICRAGKSQSLRSLVKPAPGT
ncbi:MAG: hypothetical protein U1A78_25665 [Polyangia bacterium]